MKIYGKDYPAILLAAAAELVEVELTTRNIGQLPKEITSGDIWQALVIICDWLKAPEWGRDKFPFDLHRDHVSEYSPELVAKFLLTTAFFMYNHTSNRLTMEQFIRRRECCYFYEIVVSAFIDHLAGGDFKTGIQVRVDGTLEIRPDNGNKATLH